MGSDVVLHVPHADETFFVFVTFPESRSSCRTGWMCLTESRKRKSTFEEILALAGRS